MGGGSNSWDNAVAWIHLRLRAHWCLKAIVRLFCYFEVVLHLLQTCIWWGVIMFWLSVASLSSWSHSNLQKLDEIAAWRHLIKWCLWLNIAFSLVMLGRPHEWVFKSLMKGCVQLHFVSNSKAAVAVLSLHKELSSHVCWVFCRGEINKKAADISDAEKKCSTGIHEEFGWS